MNNNETKFEPGDTLSFTVDIYYADRNGAVQSVKKGEFCKVITPFTNGRGNQNTLVSYHDFAMPLSNDALKMEEKAPAQPQNADTQKEQDEEVTRLRQQLQIAQADGIRLRDELKAEKNRNKEIRETAKGCLEAVKAMMVHSCCICATHRQRNFYNGAMIKYIKSVIADLRSVDDEPPF